MPDSINMEEYHFNGPPDDSGPNSLNNDDHPDGPLGAFCALPFVDDDEANLPPAAQLSKRGKRKSKGRGDSRDEHEGRESKRREPVEAYPADLRAENDHLWGQIGEMTSKVLALEEGRRDHLSRIRELQATVEKQNAIIDMQAQGIAYDDWQRIISGVANGSVGDGAAGYSQVSGFQPQNGSQA